ncbi:MAG: hypothetical protein RIE08_16945 [Acidimicrobiales bacterium]
MPRIDRRAGLSVAMALVGFLAAACGSAADPAPGREEVVASPDEVADDAGASSCVEQYSPETLSRRSFAFAGTVVSVGEAIDPRLHGEEGTAIPQPFARFAVDEWFRGGGPAEIDVWIQREVAVGDDLLVSGEPRWSGAPTDDPIAWECGFTSPLSPALEAEWTAVFAASDALANGVVMDDGSSRFEWELRLVDGTPCVVIEADPERTVCHDTDAGDDITYGRVPSFHVLVGSVVGEVADAFVEREDRARLSAPAVVRRDEVVRRDDETVVAWVADSSDGFPDVFTLVLVDGSGAEVSRTTFTAR